MGRVRVLQVLEATEGGTRTHLRDLVLGLDQRRYTVEVGVAVDRDPDFNHDLGRYRDHGLGVHLLPMVREVRPAADLRAYLHLRGLLRRGEYDLVHGHSSKGGFLARAAARGLGIPVLYTPNAFRFQAPDCRGLERLAVIGLERWAARWATMIICVSEGEREAALAVRIAPPEKLTVIPNGIAVEPLLEQAEVGGGRELMGASESDRIVLAVGRRVPQKGDRYLLEAWSTVARRVPEALLVIVGDGPLLGDLRRLADGLGVGERVRWVARQTNVGRLYAAAELYVLPSLYEGCPYTVLEAQALGLPCVATAVAGSRDVIRQDETGVLVPPAEPAALAEAIVGLLGDPARARRLAAAGRELVLERHTVERMVTATGALYERLLAG